MLKYVGKRVCVEMHMFPHSVSKHVKRGILTAEETINYTARNGNVISKKHYDFWLFPEEGYKKAYCIHWSEVKLIAEVNEY